MASLLHEGLVLLFRNRPTLAPDLLRDRLGMMLPPYSEARVESAELTQLVPTQYQADLVVLLLEGKPIFAIVVEVQLARDGDKRMTWPQYLTSLRARVGCPTALLVVAPDEAVARWCAQPIEVGHPGFVLYPLVTGPDEIPVITDERAASRAPELAVMSAMAHGHSDKGQDIAQAVLAGVRGLETDRASLYSDLVVSSLNDAARTALEALMQSGNYQYQSELVRKYIAQGRQEGRQEGAVVSLLKVLDGRGLQVDADARQRIQACTELEQLERWLIRALSVRSVQELFEPALDSKPAEHKADKRPLSTRARKARPKR